MRNDGSTQFIGAEITMNVALVRWEVVRLGVKGWAVGTAKTCITALIMGAATHVAILTPFL